MTSLELIGFAMGTVGFVKTVLDIWDDIETKREEHKESGVLAKELKLFGLSDRREGLKIDLELAQTIMRDRSRPKEQKRQLASRFQRLNGILEAIPKVADAVIANTSGSLHLLRRVPTIKELKAKITAFNEESSEFHQKLITLTAIVNADSALLMTSQDLTLIGSMPELTKVGEMACTAKASYIEPGKTETVVMDILIEQRPYTTQSKTEVQKNMQLMATKLKPALAAWNIPRLIGYRDNDGGKMPCMELIFEHPQPAMKLITLAGLYASGTPEPTLNLRLKLCSQIAVAVLQTHTLGMVHKHIRPENFLIAFEKDSEGELESASLFLSGWTNARLIEGVATKRIGESSVSKIIYQHPHRRLEGGSAKEDYNIGHDVYSLGVCMLELLTWNVLIWPGETKLAAPVLSDAYRRAFEHLGYHKALDLPSGDDLDDEEEVSLAKLYTRNSKEVQNTLIEMAKKLVPKRAGSTMANLVHRCLTCLDPPTKSGSGVFSANHDKSHVAEKFDNEVFDDFNKLLAVI
ncbi:hypothetical protein NW767_015528 [Fusarium falciforme]|nr:hypothetical protein NW767_015528 [Fusarium falciforme]KAJ4220331.1 hypothetical protein NW757_014512 [Fusarium falciforme]